MQQNDIFSAHNLYPYSGKINDHFKGSFEEVYIAFLPFTNAALDEHTETAEQLLEHVKPISWEQVVKNVQFNNPAELLKALKTEIGAVRPIFMRMDLKEKLAVYCAENGVFRPEEGTFDLFSKISMYRTFKLLGKTNVVIINEFYEKTIKLDLEQLSAFEFAAKIEYDDYYIYSEDRELLFALQYDSFHFLIACSKGQMEKILHENYFEGFLCDPHTENTWEYEAGELKSLLEKEENS